MRIALGHAQTCCPGGEGGGHRLELDHPQASGRTGSAQPRPHDASKGQGRHGGGGGGEENGWDGIGWVSRGKLVRQIGALTTLEVLLVRFCSAGRSEAFAAAAPRGHGLVAGCCRVCPTSRGLWLGTPFSIEMVVPPIVGLLPEHAGVADIAMSLGVLFSGKAHAVAMKTGPRAKHSIRKGSTGTFLHLAFPNSHHIPPPSPPKYQEHRPRPTPKSTSWNLPLASYTPTSRNPPQPIHRKVLASSSSVMPTTNPRQPHDSCSASPPYAGVSHGT